VHFNASDVFYDLGCGDGRTLFKAVEQGCPRAVGVDLSPTLVAELKQKVEEAGLTDRITVIQGSMLEVDLSQMTVLFLYLLPQAQALLEQPIETAFDSGSLRFVMCNTFELKQSAAARDFDSTISFYFYERPKQS
jgi:SAM-dependent methyltransferase